MSQVLLNSKSEVAGEIQLTVNSRFVDKIQEQLDDIQALEDGWDDDCKAYKPEDLTLISRLLGKELGPFAIEPALYPAAPNDVVAEWTIEKKDVFLRFFLDTYIVRFSTFVNETQEYTTREFNMTNQDDMNHLCEVLQCVIH